MAGGTAQVPEDAVSVLPTMDSPEMVGALTTELVPGSTAPVVGASTTAVR